MKQVHFAAKPPVIAFLCLFQHMQVGLQFLLVAPSGSVDPLQHFVVRISAPIRTSQLLQLEPLANMAGRRHVRPAAQIFPVALTINGDRLVRWEAFYQLGLVLLADILEMFRRFVTVPFLAHEGIVALNDFMHLRLDLFQIVGRERLVAGKIIIEAMFDGRADSDLGAGIQLLHRLRHDVGGVVADKFERVIGFAGDNFDRAVAIDYARKIDQFVIDFDGKRGLR